MYLAHLTSYVLQTVRYRLTPPMALRIDRTEGKISIDNTSYSCNSFHTSSLPLLYSLFLFCTQYTVQMNFLCNVAFRYQSRKREFSSKLNHILLQNTVESAHIFYTLNRPYDFLESRLLLLRCSCFDLNEQFSPFISISIPFLSPLYPTFASPLFNCFFYNHLYPFILLISINIFSAI